MEQCYLCFGTYDAKPCDYCVEKYIIFKNGYCDFCQNNVGRFLQIKKDDEISETCFNCAGFLLEGYNIIEPLVKDVEEPPMLDDKVIEKDICNLCFGIFDKDPCQKCYNAYFIEEVKFCIYCDQNVYGHYRYLFDGNIYNMCVECCVGLPNNTIVRKN